MVVVVVVEVLSLDILQRLTPELTDCVELSDRKSLGRAGDLASFTSVRWTFCSMSLTSLSVMSMSLTSLSVMSLE